MKAVILAGGLGTRISEETHLRPKPMVEIGGYPILWHIMKIYSSYGINEFIICLGYKGYVIKEWFANYQLHMSDVTFDMETGETIVHRDDSEPWKVTLIDTGEHTLTGGRLARVRNLLKDEDVFCLTYGDGLANVDIGELISAHKESQLWGTITAVQAPGRYGALEISGNRVSNFIEKPRGDQAWINGGYMVLGQQVFDFIDGDSTSLEGNVLPRLAREGQLSVFYHSDFWQPMDTLREKTQLEALWESNSAPWRVW
jgi:glucose-1-phosphate cytidylyltransferase